jgi:quercetin dioxygenase-like cupin family protein
LQQTFPRVSWRDAACGAGEQSYAEARFQGADGLAQSRLRNAQLGGGARKALLPRDRYESRQIVEILGSHFISLSNKSMSILVSNRGKTNLLDWMPRTADDRRLPTSSEQRQDMDIKRSGTRPSGKGPTDYFTGTVRIDPLNIPPDPARVSMALVTFEPGARTAWHTHPLGQTLIVTAGCGRVQREGGPIEEIRSGDVVWFPPGEKHWHGAGVTKP